MKKLTTMFCSICFLIVGFVLSQNKSSSSPGVATMNAAEPSSIILQGMRIPKDLQLSQGTKTVPDTITVHDTVYIKNTMHLPTNSKHRSLRIVKVPYAVKTKPDTLYLPVLYVPENFLVREEQTKNDNHSTDEQLQDSCFVPVWQRVSTLERSH